MELFNLHTTSGLAVGDKISPTRFKDALPDGAKEQDLEDLIVAFPTLLNWSEVSEPKSDNPDLLIISRQPRTQTRKRADLFAISRDGTLVIIELKRDAQDEKARREAMEFQAIRYAAASRKMTPAAVIDMFADYLKRLGEADKGAPHGEVGYREKAVDLLAKHLADEDEDEKLVEADLDSILDPKSKQKIYLVAAGYEPDVLSACAWLREHEIEIFCFRLRPYLIAGQFLLERERVIPPPDLDEFFVEMKRSGDEGLAATGGPITRRKSDKPDRLKWSDPENDQVVRSWKDVLVEGVKWALAAGLTSGKLPMKQSPDGAGLISPRQVAENLMIETNASADLIMQWLSMMLKDRGKFKGFLQIVTRSGKPIDLPE